MKELKPTLSQPQPKTKEPKFVEAEIWKLQVCSSVIDMVHGGGQTIVELYVPSIDVACNLIEGFHCFKVEDKNRYSESTNAKLIKKVNISLELSKAMIDYIENQNMFKKYIYSLLLQDNDIVNSLKIKRKEIKVVIPS